MWEDLWRIEGCQLLMHYYSIEVHQNKPCILCMFLYHNEQITNIQLEAYSKKKRPSRLNVHILGTVIDTRTIPSWYEFVSFAFNAVGLRSNCL